jgi:hypothetical protein
VTGVTHEAYAVSRSRSISEASRALIAWLRFASCALMLVAGAAHAQSIRCQPGFGPAQPDDNCDGVKIDSRNPLPDGYLAIALAKNQSVGAGWSGNKGDAEARSVLACLQHGGDVCVLAETYFNSCASIAVSVPEKITAISVLKGAGWNASELAAAKCQKTGGHSCKVLLNACYNGYVSPRPYRASGPGSSPQAPVLRRR